MIKLPKALQKKYTLLLINSDIAPDQYVHCKKWLRYYLGFCKKYSHLYEDAKSLLLFLEKLKEKKQTLSQQAQAKRAVELYYSGIEKSISQAELPVSYNDEVQEELKMFKPAAIDDPWCIAIESIKNEITFRHYSKKTSKAYSLWAQKLRYFTKNKLPESLTAEDVKSFLTFLAVKKNVSASSQNQAFNALLFFFRHVLKKEFGKIEGVVRAKIKPYIPVVLSREEIDRILENLQHPFDLVVKILYGCGLRLSECLTLRIHNFNFDHHVLTIHDGKGKKDRTVPLPESIREALKDQISQVMALHDEDLKNGYSGVFLPDRIEKKYKNAPKEAIWQ